MASQNLPAAIAVARHPFSEILLPFPIACFALALLTDIAYWRTANLLWQNFSAWLLFAGLVFGVIAALAGIADFFAGRLRFPVASVFAAGGALTLLLALLNSLAHAGDGWTAVVPYGLILSAVTVAVMAATEWFRRAMPAPYYRHGGIDVR